MTGCYSGAYEFDEAAEAGPGVKPAPQPPAPPPATAAASDSGFEAGQPHGQTCQDQQQQQQQQKHQQQGGLDAPTASPLSAHTAPAPAPAPTRQNRLLYVRSWLLARLSQLAPVNQDRALLVHSLIEACGLLQGADTLDPGPASLEQLREYHSQAHLATLARVSQLTEAQLSQLTDRQLAALAAYGLQDDCTPFPGVFHHAALTAGGSLAAAAWLCEIENKQHKAAAARLCEPEGVSCTAVHLDGGRHHAHKSLAAGFCYVNDVVLAIQRLLSTFRRILYIDTDIHHCDAVEEAFLLTDRVCTLSLHKHAPGFFPGTGALSSLGDGPGRGFSLNLPLGDGLRDGLFTEAFELLAGGAVAAYRPDCVVWQCGVDGLAHDPVGASWGLTHRAYAACAACAAGWGLPLLVLGGGGYDSPAAARTWAAVLAALQNKRLPEEVPEHEHLDRYGPSYAFDDSRPLLAPDANSRGEVRAKCERLLAALRAGLGGTPWPHAAKRARA